MLTSNGWRVRDSLEFSFDLDRYRRYLCDSRGEFTVAKDQNVRLRSGWFSEPSATYLAAGRGCEGHRRTPHHRTARQCVIA